MPGTWELLLNQNKKRNWLSVGKICSSKVNTGKRKANEATQSHFLWIPRFHCRTRMMILSGNRFNKSLKRSTCQAQEAGEVVPPHRGTHVLYYTALCINMCAVSMPLLIILHKIFQISKFCYSKCCRLSVCGPLPLRQVSKTSKQAHKKTSKPLNA